MLLEIWTGPSGPSQASFHLYKRNFERLSICADIVIKRSHLLQVFLNWFLVSLYSKVEFVGVRHKVSLSASQM